MWQWEPMKLDVVSTILDRTSESWWLPVPFPFEFPRPGGFEVSLELRFIDSRRRRTRRGFCNAHSVLSLEFPQSEIIPLYNNEWRVVGANDRNSSNSNIPSGYENQSETPIFQSAVVSIYWLSNSHAFTPECTLGYKIIRNWGIFKILEPLALQWPWKFFNVRVWKCFC